MNKRGGQTYTEMFGVRIETTTCFSETVRVFSTAVYSHSSILCRMKRNEALVDNLFFILINIFQVLLSSKDIFYNSNK